MPGRNAWKEICIILRPDNDRLAALADHVGLVSGDKIVPGAAGDGTTKAGIPDLDVGASSSGRMLQNNIIAENPQFKNNPRRASFR